MKKITLLLLLVCAATIAQAQITYTNVYTDGFETANGYPSNFLCKKQTLWATSNTNLNANVYTGSLWKDFYSNGIAANKTYQVAVDLTSPHSGSQCLKFSVNNSIFVDYVTPWDTIFTVRWRGLDNKISFNTTSGESLTKYEVSFWAKTDGANKDVLINTQTSTTKTYLTLTSTWTKYTIERYTTGTTATALGIDFAPAADGLDYVVYFDDLTVNERKIAYTSAATNITTSGFTANWAAVAGATSYSLVVEKSDGGTTPVWTAVTGSPFSVGNATNYALTGLDAAATYRYRVTATDGTITTVESNNTSATTNSATGVATIKIKSAYAANGNIYVDLNEAQEVEVFNANGQRVVNHKGITGVNTIAVNKAGLYIVKSAGEIKKIILN